jgi:hypothetical protein
LKQEASRQRSVGAPRVSDPEHLILAGQVPEVVDLLDNLPQCQVTGQDHIRTIEGNYQCSVHCPRSDPRDLCELWFDLIVWKRAEPSFVQSAVDEALCKGAQRPLECGVG